MQPHILIVDDDIHARVILGTHIRRMGCEVSEAQSGHEALSILQRLLTQPDQAIDLVITDVWMPGMSGIDLLKSIRTIAPDMPIAMISAKATLESSLEAINGGAYAYLTKPFMAEDIQSVVSRGLQKVQEARARAEVNHYTSRLEVLEDQINSFSDMVTGDVVPRDILTELISGLRHELGNMATAIKLNLEMIKDRGNMPTDLRANLDDLQATADDMVSLLMKFKEYPATARLNDLIDLVEIVIEAVESVLSKEPQLKSKIKLTGTDEEICVQGAAPELNRVILHLLDNAVNATRANRGQVFVSIGRSDNHAQIVFEDEGPGFDNLTLEQPFSPSYTTRIDDGFVRGLGLGLFITRLVISLHGGSVQLENRKQGGARVCVQLPLIECPEF